MSELKICRICLRTEAKMYKFDRYQLKSYYEEVMGIQVNSDDYLPHYICYECAELLHKFHKFKEKCYCGLKALKEIMWKEPLTYEAIYKINKTEYNLKSLLDVMSITNKVKSYSIKYSTPENEEEEKSDHQIVNIKNEDKPEMAPSFFIDVKMESAEVVILPNKVTSTEKMNAPPASRRRTRFLDANYWKKYSLTEDEALKEFRARTDDLKYLKSQFKCGDCFRGFSKDEMLSRHILLRHSESLGSFECRFCKMRFKWDSHLRIHMRQHFIRYKCLRCDLICPLENSALLHEEYHSGVKRKCIQCGDEFRHASTYYTHLRTYHRSKHVCTVCGVSFVNQTGLHQHKKIKHPDLDMDSPDDYEELNLSCEKCDLTFETKTAYEEHLFHSVLHAEGFENEIQDEITIPKKVLGKRLKAKITKEIQKNKLSEDMSDREVSPKVKRKKRMKRKRRKPTTCHQCGKHFDTQQACMKHHIAEHPRTSFYSTSERHICELCGASLAPGSVAVHKNMHSREKMFKCDTCHKEFHSTVGLKRHFITHTGQKPFACTLCDKRFTQSNSMKLHYKTFHLKQPYPKRNRSKKLENENQEEQEIESSESESADLPQCPPGVEVETSDYEPLRYLTLH